MAQKLLIASQNPGKIREIQEIFSNSQFHLLSTHDLSINFQVKETGQTYSENARLKALKYLIETQLPTIADDSGLEVDALDGNPGIYSARWSQKINANDKDRRMYLVEQLRAFPQPWTAHFHCTALAAFPDGEIIETSGRCDGIIIPEERGTNGFGYDPIFYIPKMDATMAELPQEIKNHISHRAIALSALIPLIKTKIIESK
jgi:XTP/dITP diphosphohydrolase